MLSYKNSILYCLSDQWTIKRGSVNIIFIILWSGSQRVGIELVTSKVEFLCRQIGPYNGTLPSLEENLTYSLLTTFSPPLQLSIVKQRNETGTGLRLSQHGLRASRASLRPFSGGVATAPSCSNKFSACFGVRDWSK